MNTTVETLSYQNIRLPFEEMGTMRSADSLKVFLKQSLTTADNQPDSQVSVLFVVGEATHEEYS